MDQIIIEIVRNYWSQIVVILTALGIILQIIINYSVKKREINHEIYYKNQMNALIRFYKSYSELQSLWTSLPIYRIFRNELIATEIDNLIQPALNKFEASIIELDLFSDNVTYSIFEEIEANTRSIYTELRDMYFNNEIKGTIKANLYFGTVIKMNRENKRLLKEINKLISDTSYRKFL